MMENSVIKDTSLEKISASDSKVRFTAKVVKKDDKTGTFEVSDKGKSIICLPPPTGSFDINEGDLAVITGRIASSDGVEFEIRTDYVKRIGPEEYKNYDKYLKIRGEL
ncbi:hypothetical protein M1139_01595 [Candidatus Parvarchaeota archaeon]|jgi:DNA/RNA endonuclease YhcR with UshA esterase domain|nr:hypothetical protein [Candidatus Parvarchaeota archaeon]